MFRAKHIKASPRVANEDRCIRELEVFTPIKRESRDKLLNEVRSKEWMTLFVDDEFGFMLLPFDIVAGEFGYWACSKTWGAVHTRRNSFWSLLHWRIWIGLWRCYFTNHFFLAASFGRTLEHHWRGMSTSLNSFEVDSSFNYIYTHSFIVSHPCLNQSVYYQEKIFLDRDLLFFAWVWLTKSSRDKAFSIMILWGLLLWKDERQEAKRMSKKVGGPAEGILYVSDKGFRINVRWKCFWEWELTWGETTLLNSWELSLLFSLFWYFTQFLDNLAC